MTSPLGVPGRSTAEDMETTVVQAEKQIDSAYQSLENSVVKASVKSVALDEFMKTLYDEVIEDLLDSKSFSLCVTIVAISALVECEDEEEARKESQRRTADWIRASPFPNSQSSIESNYVSPPPSSSSSFSSNNFLGGIESSPVQLRIQSSTCSSQNQSVPAEPSSPTLTADSERLSMVPVEVVKPGRLERFKRMANSFCERIGLKRPRLK